MFSGLGANGKLMHRALARLDEVDWWGVNTLYGPPIFSRSSIVIHSLV